MFVAAIERVQEVAEEDFSQRESPEASQRDGGLHGNGVHGGLDAVLCRFADGNIRRRERRNQHNTRHRHHSIALRQRIHRLQSAHLRRLQHSGGPSS